MSGKHSTIVMIVGLAALFCVVAAGCSNLNKAALDTTAATISPPQKPPAGNRETPFRQRTTEPLAGVFPPADSAPTSFGLEDRLGVSADPTSEASSGPATLVVSDKIVLPRSVVHVKESDFDAEVLESDVPVLVDFYADWCGPCKKLSPLLDQLAYQTEGARIVKVNIDDSPQLAIRYGVKGIPHLKVFKDGKAVGQHVGMANRQQLAELLSL